jgi:HSP20 family molecular chaperone IbpA
MRSISCSLGRYHIAIFETAAIFFHKKAMKASTRRHPPPENKSVFRNRNSPTMTDSTDLSQQRSHSYDRGDSPKHHHLDHYNRGSHHSFFPGFADEFFHHSPFSKSFDEWMPVLHNLERGEDHIIHHSSPGYEINETEKSYQIAIDVPGVHLQDLSLQLENYGHVLRVKGRREMQHKDQVRETKFEKRFRIGVSFRLAWTIDSYFMNTQPTHSTSCSFAIDSTTSTITASAPICQRVC